MNWIITYENAHWCGGELYVVVLDAETAEQAEFLAGDFMDETQRELFSDEIADAFEEDPDFDDSYMASVTSIEVLDENNKHWEFYKNPSQASFYPEIVAQ